MGLNSQDGAIVTELRLVKTGKGNDDGTTFGTYS